MALCDKEREAHRATDEHRIGHVQEALDESDLVCHLRAAEHRHQRPNGPLDDPAQYANLALHQPSGGTRQQVSDSLGAGVRPVAGAERVVDVDVSELGERPGELGIVLSLPRLIAHVLEHEDLPFSQMFGEPLDLLADHRCSQRHVCSCQLSDPVRYRAHRQLRIAVVGPAQV